MGSAFAGFRKTARSNMAERQAGTLESVIPGRHICKQMWQPLVEEILTLKWEEGNNHDKFTVSLLKHATALAMFFRIFVGHFLRNGKTITCEVIQIEESYFPVLVLFVLCTTSPVVY